MYLVVDHAGQQMQTCRIYSLVSFYSYSLPDLRNASVFYQYIGSSYTSFVYELGVFYEELAVFSDLEQKEGLLCSVNTYKKSHSKVAQILTLKIKTS